MNRFPGGSFDVSNMAKGPRDEAAGGYRGSAKVRILWGGEQMWELAISAPWHDGETPADFQRRVMQIASRQMAELALAMNQASAAETAGQPA